MANFLSPFQEIHFSMAQTMRWFGPEDPVKLLDLLQSGCTGVVTALHHIPIGEVWPLQEIEKRILEIENSGLKWLVVESLPVHESIKTQSPGFEKYLDHFIQSIINLAEKGIKTITYNFMPVLDWTRTHLYFNLSNGSKALYFEKAALMAFDLFILKRKSAFKEYSGLEIQFAKERFLGLNDLEKKELEDTIIKGLPGAEAHFTLESFQEMLSQYENLDKAQLRENLIFFLEKIIPICDEFGVKMAIHPDDPPFSLFGLPRIVSSMDDFIYLEENVPSINNGICFCTGSLGVNPENDLVKIIRRFKDRIHFVHLRNIKRNDLGDFYEEDHLIGDVDMYSLVKELVFLMQERKISLPMRPDHGHQILDDLKKEIKPGYSAIGRLKGMAELRGLELGILRNQMEINR